MKISLEPNYDRLVEVFHSPLYTNRKWWMNSILSDDSGWFAAVAATHPDKKIQRLGRSSYNYDPTKSYAGIPQKTQIKPPKKNLKVAY